jgi:NAD(P)-dependent dehydrogenase (short-subunit alcohol dehydrogenase family)
MKKTVLIIGASRGLGLEFVTQYLNDGCAVIATAKKHADVARLAAIGATAYEVDVIEPADFVALKEKLAETKIDVAIYNAGVYGPATTGVQAVSKADFDAVMHVNVWGALHAVPAVAPLVSRAKGVFVFVSSTMGSMTEMDGPNRVVYRASKAALNAVVKAASIEWADSGMVSFALHPGWVRTDMGGKGADIDPAESVGGMRNVIALASAHHNGGFFDYQGRNVPW